MPVDSRSVRFLRFAFLGLLPTSAYYLLVISLVETGLLSAEVSMPAGFITAVIISYQLNKHFTWKPETSRASHFQLYVLISLFGALTNYLLFILIVQWLELSYIVAVLAVTVVIPVQNFILNEKFNFK